MKIVYEVLRNMDQNEGRGPMKRFAAFSNKADAIVASKGQDGWGGDAQIEPIHVFESVEEYETKTRMDIKTRALNKLSDEEKEALGL